MKKSRHEVIISLIKNESIETQEELMQKLNSLGYPVTQATVLRDIKSLKLVKTPIEAGKYRYTLSNSETEVYSGKYYSILAHAVTGVDYAGNMVVIKCYAGMANAACAALDNLMQEQIVGTLAGDDTIFALCRTEELASDFKDNLNKIVEANR